MSPRPPRCAAAIEGAAAGRRGTGGDGVEVRHVESATG